MSEGIAIPKELSDAAEEHAVMLLREHFGNMRMGWISATQNDPDGIFDHADSDKEATRVLMQVLNEAQAADMQAVDAYWLRARGPDRLTWAEQTARHRFSILLDNAIEIFRAVEDLRGIMDDGDRTDVAVAIWEFQRTLGAGLTTARRLGSVIREWQRLAFRRDTWRDRLKSRARRLLPRRAAR